MESFTKSNGTRVILDIIKVVKENKQYLSDIDGLIGDGDHGINMNKGMVLCEGALTVESGDMVHSMEKLSKILMGSIGGSMGPIYGQFFRGLAKAAGDHDVIDSSVFEEMLQGAREGIEKISEAKPGDKTLMDTLVPAVESFSSARAGGRNFSECLDEMKKAARKGRDSTKDLMSKVGRSSRLGERSRGVLDPGAVSCYLILESMVNSIKAILKG